MRKNLLLLFLIIPFLTNAQLKQDDFESYALGNFDTQWNTNQWVGWFNDFSGVEISNEQAASGTNSIKVSDSPSADDLMALLGVLDSGIIDISFKQFIPADNGAYFNLQHNYQPTSGDWAVDVFFSDATQSEGTITTDGQDFTFDIIHDTWASILFILNFDTEEAQFFYNDQLIHTWVLPTNVGGGPGLNAINGINFFAGCDNCTSLAYYDDVVIEQGTLPEFSVSLDSDIMETEYFNVPVAQTSPLGLSATVANNGENDVNNVSVIASVFDGNNNEIYSESLGLVATLAAGESVTLNSPANTFTPSTSGSYSLVYTATSDELSDILDNNTNSTFNVSDSIYTRDDGNYFNGLGSMGEPAIFGHLYEVVNSDAVTGINVTYAGEGVGETVQGRIMALSSTGNPTDIIAMTEVITIEEAGSLGNEASLHVPFSTPLDLEPGNYVFLIEQLGNTSLGIAIAANIFTPNTSFLSINNGSTWDALEDIGFEGSLAIHPVFGGMTVSTEEPNFAQSMNLTPNVTEGRATVSIELVSTQDLLIEVYNTQGRRVFSQNLINASGNIQHELDLSNQASGMYFVTISSDGKRTSRKLNIVK